MIPIPTRRDAQLFKTILLNLLRHAGRLHRADERESADDTLPAARPGRHRRALDEELARITLELCLPGQQHPLHAFLDLHVADADRTYGTFSAGDDEREHLWRADYQVVLVRDDDGVVAGLHVGQVDLLDGIDDVIARHGGLVGRLGVERVREIHLAGGLVDDAEVEVVAQVGRRIVEGGGAVEGAAGTGQVGPTERHAQRSGVGHFGGTGEGDAVFERRFHDGQFVFGRGGEEAGGGFGVEQAPAVLVVRAGRAEVVGGM